LQEAKVAEAEEPQDVAPKKSKKPLIIGGILAILLGAGGFFVAYSGLLFASDPKEVTSTESVSPLPNIAFVPIEPLVISLGSIDAKRHLRFTSQIEVGSDFAADVTLLLPRIIDVMNGYLRAIEPAQLDDPAMLLRIRAQLLRRIQMVTGTGRVRDLLVTEFVLN
jgi:flagellar FliL protein